jgi:hypothetical protein
MSMQTNWGYTGIPYDALGTPVIDKVHSLVSQDVALAEGARMRGFSERQYFLGFRQTPTFIRPPEVNVGALMDLGS